MRISGMTIAAVTSILRDIRDDIDGSDDSEAYADVRLVVGRNWRDTEWIWEVNSGSADYDQWHGMVCGSSSVEASDTVKHLTATARDLITQVQEELTS